MRVALITCGVLLVGATILLFLLAGTKPPDAPLTTAQIVTRASESIAVVGDGFGHGTGFLVRDGILITNAHVTRGTFVEEIALSFGEDAQGEDHVLALLHDDAEHDLCLLRVQTKRPPLELAQEDSVSPGTEVLVIGNPGLGMEQLQNVVTRGLAGSMIEYEGVSYLQIGAAVNPGNSGGPVLDARGRVVSVVSWKSRELEGVSFGVPVGTVRRALARASTQDEEARAALVRRHDAKAAFLGLTWLGRLHILVAHASLSNAAEAVSSGEAAVPAVLRTRRTSSEPLSEGRLRIRAIQPHIERIGKDLGFDHDYRLHLNQLWAAIVSLEACNLAPVEDMATLQQRMEDGAALFERLRRTLTQDLAEMGASVDDLDEE